MVNKLEYKVVDVLKLIEEVFKLCKRLNLKMVGWIDNINQLRLFIYDSREHKLHLVLTINDLVVTLAYVNEDDVVKTFKKLVEMFST